MRLTDEAVGRELASKVITFLETGAPPAGVFTRDAFCDFTLPQWRLQGQGVDDIVRMRTAGHPGTSRVPRSRFDTTSTGFVLEVEEEWDQDGESWYCRELLRADVADGAISQLHQSPYDFLYAHLPGGEGFSYTFNTTIDPGPPPSSIEWPPPDAACVRSAPGYRAFHVHQSVVRRIFARPGSNPIGARPTRLFSDLSCTSKRSDREVRSFRETANPCTAASRSVSTSRRLVGSCQRV